MNKYKITFICYVWSPGQGINWEEYTKIIEADNEQEARDKCIQKYGLYTGCDYRITTVKKIIS